MNSLTSYAKAYGHRLRGGELGALPAVAGLLVLCMVFGLVRPTTFLTAGNVANLFTQGAAVIVIAMGLVFVLLMGEIDLSAGFTSGVCAAVLAVALTEQGLPWYVAVLAAIAAGVVIGLLLGVLVAKLGIPSFVVTLAAFLAFQGVLLLLLDEGTNISIHDPIILAIANDNMAPWMGWVFASIAVGGFAAVQLTGAYHRRSRGLATVAWQVVALRIGSLALFLGLMVAVLNTPRGRRGLLEGVPIVVPLIAVLLVLLTFVLRRTAYGRHVYATGGNKEAARRAGINVDRIRISVFVICSSLAAIGGIIAASRGNSVDPNTGGSKVLLYAVGAAVIGGTSLFGGKGQVLDAVLGGLVVAVIDNGMGLLGYSSALKFIVTGTVLLLAASVDAVSRKRADTAH